MIDPFANNHQSMQIGELVIENQQDKITIYGDIDLMLDASGYQQAQQLHELTTKIMQALTKVLLIVVMRQSQRKMMTSRTKKLTTLSCNYLI